MVYYISRIQLHDPASLVVYRLPYKKFVYSYYFDSSFCPLWLLFSTSTAWLYYFRLSVVWECENFWKWLQLCHTCCLSTYDTELLYSSLTFILRLHSFQDILTYEWFESTSVQNAIKDDTLAIKCHLIHYGK